MRRDQSLQRTILDLSSNTSLGAIFAKLGGTLYDSQAEQGWLEVNRLELVLPRLAPEFDGYRLVHLSDLHVSQWTSQRRLWSIVQDTNRLHPDLIAITGDFITTKPEVFASELIPALKALQAKDGIYAVLGNHDHTSNAQTVRQILKKSGVHELRNSVYTVERGQARLHIAGVDDYMYHHDRFDQVLEALPAEEAAVLLAHEPDFALRSAPTGRFGLQLSGHSHGGQIRLPFLGPLFLPKYSKKYPSGLYRLGDMTLYTNRGLGVTHLPVRFNARPEIALITLCTG